ncbi:DNA/RNA non-specific endonuclease [Leptothoe kymatousa]|uniref:Endonuclease n=1 Tax=Leptothoe kymatousa TAU-MAC 1615 TaxID=2364775 RepID=A0ABS5Y1Q2_9CYAN|nr:DNA/RNA non-specific endonuclease [Leptothoe kymatousa]MBT9310930.1 DNA/RNA non-specific endonuclease [Leptothoe kymatousa TAU-MAC 1615]
MGKTLKRHQSLSNSWSWIRHISTVGTFLCILTGCENLATEISDPNAHLPPCVEQNCDCGDFISQELAQLVLDEFQGDPFKLDGDGNGQACERRPATTPELDWETYFSNSPHLVLGNPSHGGQENIDNYLIDREQYALAYSQSHGVLRWASWVLSPQWVGPAERQNDFRPDGILPKGTYQVTPRDYTGSGYDRGHMVPSADRTANEQDNSATFLMTNIFPQTAENNRGPWRELENYSRDLMYQQGKTLYIIAGIYGEQRPIAKDKVIPPSRTWKVIVVFDEEPSIENVTYSTQIIAVDMPNDTNLDEQWQSYQTSVDRIELATGYNLLSNIPEALQNELESRRSQR